MGWFCDARRVGMRTGIRQDFNKMWRGERIENYERDGMEYGSESLALEAECSLQRRRQSLFFHFLSLSMKYLSRCLMFKMQIEVGGIAEAAGMRTPPACPLPEREREGERA